MPSLSYCVKNKGFPQKNTFANVEITRKHFRNQQKEISGGGTRNLKFGIFNFKFQPDSHRDSNLKFEEEYLCKKNIISPLRFLWKGQTLWLSEKRCIYWEDQKMLILSDPHFGKAGHFRQSGIQIPQQVSKDNLFTFLEVISFFHPEIVLITGDMFHSKWNAEVDHFMQEIKHFGHIHLILVKGNHDILNNTFYEQSGFEVIEGYKTIDKFCFTHDTETIKTSAYLFSGHIHPAFRISTASKQSLKLPCFYFGKKSAILPAFGKFTGTALIEPEKNDPLFCLTEKEVIRIQ